MAPINGELTLREDLGSHPIAPITRIFVSVQGIWFFPSAVPTRHFCRASLQPLAVCKGWLAQSYAPGKRSSVGI